MIHNTCWFHLSKALLAGKETILLLDIAIYFLDISQMFNETLWQQELRTTKLSSNTLHNAKMQ